MKIRSVSVMALSIGILLAGITCAGAASLLSSTDMAQVEGGCTKLKVVTCVHNFVGCATREDGTCDPSQPKSPMGCENIEYGDYFKHSCASDGTGSNCRVTGTETQCGTKQQCHCLADGTCNREQAEWAGIATYIPGVLAF